MNEKEWNQIVNNYYNGYCTSLQTLILRRKQRELYLTNQSYNKTWYVDYRTLAWQKWYLQKYRSGVINSKNNNRIPC